MSQKKDMKEINQYINLLIKMGMNMILSLLIFIAIGITIDKHFNTNGKAILITIVFGLISGFYLMFKEIKKIESDT